MTTPGPPRTTIRPQEGDTIDQRFLLTSLLGEGYSGFVYAAVDQSAGRDVALKFIHRDLVGDRQVRARFHREAAILARVRGSHVVSLLSFGEHDGLLYMALDRAGGQSLEALLGAGEPLEAGRAVSIGIAIARALEQAHAADVIHRDLKPANVIVESRDGRDTVMVLDFGMAKVLQGEPGSVLTEQNMIFGTPQYMAPEQARGEELDGRCDIYALGVILYELLTGTVPFDGRAPMATLTAHLTEKPVPPATRAPQRGISAAIEAVVLGALEKNPSNRYPTATAFREALEHAAAAPTDAVSVRPTRQTPSIAPAATVSADAAAQGFAMPPFAWVLLIVVTSILGAAIGVLAALRI